MHCTALVMLLSVIGLLTSEVWASGANCFHYDSPFVDSVCSASILQAVGPQPLRATFVHNPVVEEAAGPSDEGDHPNLSDTSGSSTKSGSVPHHEEESESESEHEKEILAIHLKSSPAATAVAFMLFCMILFQMAVYYLVNFPDEDIQHFTWISLSCSISIFGALNIWHAVKSTSDFVMRQKTSANPLASEEPKHHGHPFEVIILFSILYVFFHGCMCCSWSNRIRLVAFGMISAHTLGFAAVDAVGHVLMAAPWNASIASFSMATALVGLVIFVLLELTSYMRSKGCEKYCDTEENRLLVEGYLDACIESENEFAGFLLGLLVTQAIVWFDTGSMPPTHGFSFEKNMTDVQGLFLGAVATSVVLFLFVVFIRKVFKDEESPVRSRAIEIIEMTLSMTIGWTLLFAGRWLFWVITDDHGIGSGELMLARMVQALCFSGWCFFNIFFFDFLSDREYMDHTALRALMKTMGILMGLAWESAFGEAIETIVRDFATTPDAKFSLMSLLGLAGSVIVLPAWYYYLLPRAIADQDADDLRERQRTASWKMNDNGKLAKSPTSFKPSSRRPSAISVCNSSRPASPSVTIDDLGGVGQHK